MSRRQIVDVKLSSAIARKEIYPYIVGEAMLYEVFVWYILACVAVGQTLKLVFSHVKCHCRSDNYISDADQENELPLEVK